MPDDVVRWMEFSRSAEGGVHNVQDTLRCLQLSIAWGVLLNQDLRTYLDNDTTSREALHERYAYYNTALFAQVELLGGFLSIVY